MDNGLLLTPLGAALVASEMIVATAAVRVKKDFWATGGGNEYNLVLGVAALSIALTGPGKLSFDALLGYSLGGIVWGVGAAVVAVLGAAVQLAMRRMPMIERGTSAVLHSVSDER